MFTLGELAKAVGGSVKGDPQLAINGFCSAEQPSSGCIAFLEKPRDVEQVRTTAAAVITTDSLAGMFDNAIVATEPRRAFALVVRMFRPLPKIEPGIHERAVVSPSAQIDQSATIGPGAAIGEEVRIGPRSCIHAGVVVSAHAVIGADCEIGPNVSIYDGVRIGDRVRINAGTVIGAPGFGFTSARDGHHRFPQVGGVSIEDDVEIGSNCCVDRASLDDTVIHRGTKIDNLVQIAHGVIVGAHTMIAAQTGISGGTTLGEWCVVGGQAGFQGHITIGDQSIIAAQSGVFSDLPAKSKVSGYPAKPHRESLRVLALTFRLPEMLDKIRSLEIEIEMMRGELQSLRDRGLDLGGDLPEGKA
jgi:UDP-3-O-[3-hydroxymyristoyl] glucosamine N-acyltransferase